GGGGSAGAAEGDPRVSSGTRPRRQITRWRAVVPASTSNLGPGFDCLGLALQIPMTVTAERIDSGFSIRRLGEGSDLALDPNRDAVLGAYRHLFRAAKQPVPTIALTI